MSIGSDIVIERSGWLETLLVSRTSNAVLSVLILVAALTVFRRIAGSMLVGVDGADPTIDRRIVTFLVLAGTLDVLGLIVFTYGLENAETWLVGLASSFGPAVTIIYAVLFMGERLRPIQWLGLSFVLAGMIAIGLPPA
jgi:drug/metabolite transporter (DMT)-like permease